MEHHEWGDESEAIIVEGVEETGRVEGVEETGRVEGVEDAGRVEGVEETGRVEGVEVACGLLKRFKMFLQPLQPLKLLQPFQPLCLRQIYQPLVDKFNFFNYSGLIIGNNNTS